MYYSQAKTQLKHRFQCSGTTIHNHHYITAILLASHFASLQPRSQRLHPHHPKEWSVSNSSGGTPGERKANSHHFSTWNTSKTDKDHKTSRITVKGPSQQKTHANSCPQQTLVGSGPERMHPSLRIHQS